MSEMGSDDLPVTGADRLNTALIGFTGCVGEAVQDICSYGLTIGESYVPFDPDEGEDCDVEEAACSQLWVRVESVTPIATDSWQGDCATVMTINLEVGIVRCIEIAEDGEAPTMSEVLLAATQSMDDMQAIYCAAMGCEVWESINVGLWTPTGPLGGQYGGIWTFTVEV